MRETKKILLLLFIFTIPLALAGCSKDEDDNPWEPKDKEIILADEVAGKYNGIYTINGVGEEVTQAQEIEVELIKTGDNEVKIVIGEISFSMVNGHVTARVNFDPIEEIVLSGKEKQVSFEESRKNATFTFYATMMGDVDIPVGDGELSIEGIISEGSDLTIKVVLVSEFVYDRTVNTGAIEKMEINITAGR